MIKSALAAICFVTLAATAYLSLSLIILHPPRANYQEWLPVAALFATQSGVTLIVLAGTLSGGAVRWLLLAGAVTVMWLGAAWALATITGSHFEGYALVLGSLLVVQGILTLAYLGPQVLRTLSPSR
jgi:hypothetical protein